jgi:hypothetical protein
MDVGLHFECRVVHVVDHATVVVDLTDKVTIKRVRLRLDGRSKPHNADVAKQQLAKILHNADEVLCHVSAFQPSIDVLVEATGTLYVDGTDVRSYLLEHHFTWTDSVVSNP